MFIEKIAIFMIFLGPLVFFHELGHFLFARLAGVKVEVFSIGFGPKIFKKKWGDTEYAFSLIPLGGYVKMFGDDPLSEVELTDEEKAVAFTHKSKWRKFWIIFGGPLANFILAYFIYFALVVSGENVPQARFGVIPENTRYYELGLRSGDILKNVNTSEILSFDDLNMVDSEVKKLTIVRENKEISFDVDLVGLQFIKDFASFRGQLRAPILSDSKGNSYIISKELIVDFNLSLEQLDSEKLEYVKVMPVTSDLKTMKKIEDIKYDTSKVVEVKLSADKAVMVQLIKKGFYPRDLFIESIVMGSPADKAKLAQGNVIVNVNGKYIHNFEQLRTQVQMVKENESLKLKVLENGKEVEKTLTPKITEVNGQKVKTIGVYSGIVFLPLKMVESKAKNLIDGISSAWYRTVEGTEKTFLGFKKLISGEVGLKNIGGPLAIGKVASDSFGISLSMFFRLMAIISINLGMINLFPIPVLDGGHIVFLFLELVNGGPLSKKKMMIAQQLGMSMLFLLIFVALFNDISRLF
jgi:regulator of sigma E protease